VTTRTATVDHHDHLADVGGGQDGVDFVVSDRLFTNNTGPPPSSIASIHTPSRTHNCNTTTTRPAIETPDGIGQAELRATFSRI